MRFCSNCGEPIDENSKWCKSCGHKHKKEGNIILYFILMILLVFVFDIVSNLILSFSNSLITGSRFGLEFILEGIWALIVFFILIMAGNTYIFRRKRMPLYKSICLAVPIVILTVIYLANYLAPAISYSPIDVVCALFLCICVGLMEEFLCRGWILTEFLERYGYDRKHVHYAIILSAMIFAGMHFTNVLNGQSVFDTVLQIIQTLGSGYLFGCLFYRTRNIWACVLTHGIYDFGIYMSEIAVYQTCTSAVQTPKTMALDIITSLIFAAIYIACGEIIIRKSKTNELLPEPEKLKESDIVQSEQLKKYLIGFAILCVVVLEFIPVSDSTTCENYTKKDITENYYITTPYVQSYSINYADYSFEITKLSDNYEIINKNTSHSIELDDDAIRVIEISNSSYFAIAEVIYDDSYEYSLKYIQVNYSDITDDDSFLDDLMKYAKEYEVPTVTSVGTISFEKGGEEYFYFESDEIKQGMIDSDKNLYELVEK